MRYLSVFVLVLGLVFGWPITVGAEMSSASYQIYADNLEAGGGNLSGGSYSLESTHGESPIGIITGSTYEIRSGYQYMEVGSLALDISPSSIDLGTLSTDAVSQDSSTLTVSTASDSGYSLSTNGISGTSLTAVADGSVTAGEEEYGFSGSGLDNQLSGDVAITDSLLVSASSTSVTGSATVLTFKASISSGSTSGSYSQSITFTVVSNF